MTGALALWPHLALAVAVIAAAAFVAGGAARLLGQPRVIGEVLAGILLGPTLLGALSPHLFHELFPPALHGKISTLAWAGVVLFVFFVGLEFSPALVRARARLVALLGAGSLAVPLLAGCLLALPLAARLQGHGTPRGAFVLFLGIAVSITAFPVLAAILDDLGLTRRPLGQLALGTAAVTDVVAWCLLALVAADVRSAGPLGAGARLLGAVALAVAVVFLLRPLLARILAACGPAAATVRPLVGVGLALGLAGTSDRLGVSFVFGAFLAGLALEATPGGEGPLLRAIRGLDRGLLLPVFFAATGLSIDLRSAATTHLLAAGALVLVVATAAKLGGVLLAARVGGVGWREGATLGFLLNTKGLTELVVLKLGYDLGLLTTNALGMLIVVALLITASTAPLVTVLGALRVPALAAPVIGEERLARELGDGGRPD